MINITRLVLQLLMASTLVLHAAQSPARPEPGRIDQQQVLASQGEPGNWLHGGRDYGQSHYSPLTQINRTTVTGLGYAWPSIYPWSTVTRPRH